MVLRNLIVGLVVAQTSTSAMSEVELYRGAAIYFEMQSALRGEKLKAVTDSRNRCYEREDRLLAETVEESRKEEGQPWWFWPVTIGAAVALGYAVAK